MGELGEQALLDLLESRADESLYEDDDVCRLAQLAGALAEDLPHVNLAFQDDEPRAIALDMLDPECDDLPWRLDGEEVELRRRASMPPPGVGRLRNSLDRPQSGPGQLCTTESAYSNPTSLSEALLSWECPNDKQLSGPSSWSGGLWEQPSPATQVQLHGTQDLWTASPAESTRDQDKQIKKVWETFAEDSLPKSASPWELQSVRWSFGPDKSLNQDVENCWDNSSVKSPTLPRNFCSNNAEDILKNSAKVGLQQSSENGFLKLLNLPGSEQNQPDSGIGPEDIVLTEKINSEVFSESEGCYGSLPKESRSRTTRAKNIIGLSEMSTETIETEEECKDPHPFIPGKRKDATNTSDTQEDTVQHNRTLELGSVSAVSEGQERGYSCASDDESAQNLAHSGNNRHVVYGIPDTSETWEWFSERQRSESILEEVTVDEEETHSCRPDPGPDLICALATEPTISLNHEEEQPRNNALETPQAGTDQDAASGEEDDDIDWSWVAALLDMRGEEDADSMKNQQEQQDAEPPPAPRRPSSSSWLRASMRRLRPLRLSDPVPTAPPPEPSAPPPPPPPLPPPPDTPLSPLATPETVVEILSAASTPVRSVPQPPPNGRPRSAPVSYTRARDFPRRYSNYSVQQQPIQVVSPPPVPPPRQEHHEEDEEEDEEEDDLEEEDVSSSSEDANNRRCNNTEDSDMSGHSPLGMWPHNLSSVLASLGCTLGLFNINRFAFLSVQYGANFIVQFLFLTLVMGIPLYTLHSCLGQCLNAGVMDMWKISPIFQGIGIALLVSQALIGIYSIVGVSWMFIYFRDSFITRQERYRWAEPFEFYRQDSYVAMNGSWKLEETVPDYLNGVVLQRHNLATPDSSFGHLKFQVTFNLAVVWMIIFVCLSKGLKSYGKVVYVFALLPVFGMLILCTKLLGLTPTTTTHQVFPQTVWSEFFLNTKCWVAAATETFFTWGLLGVAVMQITSHNRNKHLLNRDTSLVIVLTIAVLLLAAFLANTCVSLLHSNGFFYIPSSFEQMSTYQFLAPTSEPLQPALASTPVRYLAHTTFILGEKVALHGVDTRHQSGYQVLRFATELFPATLALLGIDTVSPFWSVLFYFVLILFGIAQQLAIWHSVITGIMAINASILKSWETTITFFSCACGFVLGLPMTTELGIFVVYFLDYSIGGAWWIMVLYLLEIVVIFVVRGRPYSGETVVATLFRREATGCLQTWAAPMLVFMWNVFLPIALVVLCITVFRSGQFRELYDWRHLTYNYWPVWTRELGCLLQLAPIMAVLMVCIIQTCRYLSDGPPDIFDRIQLLYRPSLGPYRPRIEVPVHTTSTPPSVATANPTPVTDTTVSAAEDPPPKYTPPPSYTTATGARIAKLLRRSFRRSMRRLAGTLSDGREDLQQQQQSPPPDYATVLVEMNQGAAVSAMPATVARNSTMTAADVAHLLRSSLRRTLRQGDGSTGGERLVDGAAPIHRDSKIDNTSSM